MEDKNELIETAEALKALAQNEDAAVEMVRVGLDIKEEDYPKIRQTITEFVSDYQKKDDATTDTQWLVQSFNRYPKLWKDANDIEQTAEAIVATVYAYEKNRQELEDHLAAGKQRGSWISKKLEQGAAFSGVQQVNQYAAHLDQAISNANRQMADTIRTMNGEINQNQNLDGLIAEQHHANTFNLDAAQKEQPFYAETRKSTGKNSVDIVVRDADGKIAQKYQSKYGKDTEHTEQYFKDGNYCGQQKLVAEGQGKDINKAHEKIEFTDYKSKKKETINQSRFQKKRQRQCKKKPSVKAKLIITRGMMLIKVLSQSLLVKKRLGLLYLPSVFREHVFLDGAFRIGQPAKRIKVLPKMFKSLPKVHWKQASVQVLSLRHRAPLLLLHAAVG